MKIAKLTRGRFVVVCSTVEEYKDSVTCYRDEESEEHATYALKLGKVAKGKTVTVEALASKEYVDKGGGFGRFSADVSCWLNPYFEKLRERVGAAAFPVDFTPICRRITHTHITESLICDGNITTAVHIGHVYGHSGTREISAEQFERWGVESVDTHTANEFGETIVQPEYIQHGNGLFSRNPKYPGRFQYRPIAGNEACWQFLFGEWLFRFATAGQKALIGRFARVPRSKELFPSLRHREINLDNYHAVATWGDLACA